MNSLLLVASIQALFFSGLILGLKKPKEHSDFILAIWLIFIGLHTLIYFLFSQMGIFNINIIIANAAFPFLQGPLLLVYVEAKVKPGKGFDKLNLIHFIPYFVLLFYQLWNYYLSANFHSGGNTHKFVGFFDNYNIFGLFFLISLPLYVIVAFIKTTRLKFKSTINVAWVRVLILFVGGIWLSSLLVFLLPGLIDHQIQIRLNSIIFISLTGFVYLISYLGFKEKIFITDIPKIIPEKYHKSKLTDEEMDKEWLKIEKYMLEKEPFLEPEFNLTDLAKHLSISSNKLSQIINRKSGMNFYDFINRYRVEKTKHLINSDKFDHYSLLAIAQEAGFSTKSTFNRVFKRFENCTPSEYRDNKVS